MKKLNDTQLINFWKKVDKNISNIYYKGTRCWEWTGGCCWGYGSFRVSPSKKEGSHRISYFLKNGDFQNDLFVCHHCDNPKCVNPNHLFLGNNLENQLDMLSKNRGNKAFGDRNGTRVYPERVIQEEMSHFSKLKRDDVLEILDLYHNTNFTQMIISKMFGITRGNVGHIIRGNIWKDTYKIFMDKEKDKA